MTKKIWMYAGLALVLVAGSGLTYIAGVRYVPSMLMFVAAIMVLGFSMSLEDKLLEKYDTPHDDDTHPPQLVTLRAVRAAVLLLIGITMIAMLF